MSMNDLGTVGTVVTVLGQGLFGSALTRRLQAAQSSKYEILGVGSRSEQDPEDAMARSSIVILCVPGSAHQDVAERFSAVLAGKIVVDVSNIPGKAGIGSFEALESHLPSSQLVKAFNTLSAYSLGDSNTFGDSMEVPVCGDSLPAKAQVMQLARLLGMQGIDAGDAQQADAIQHMATRCFEPETHLTAAVSLAMFTVAFVYAYFRYYVYKEWEAFRFAMHIGNKIFCWTALDMLALSFLPGPIVQIMQLVRGRAYIELPNWFALWMRARKQMGLAASWFVLVHVLMSLAILTPAYFGKFYGESGKFNEAGEVAFCLGAIAISLLVPMNMASLSPVAKTLSWMEWHFIFHNLGWLSLLFATFHTFMTGYKSWDHEPSSWPGSMPPITMMSCLLPFLAIGLKSIVVLFFWRLNAIKSGKLQHARAVAETSSKV